MTARVLVIGGGPAGMATAASMRARGVAIRHIDRRGRVGGAYNRIHGDIVLTTPARLIGLPGLPFRPTADYVNVDEYRSYLHGFARRFALHAESCQVERIRRDGDGFAVHFTSARHALAAEVPVADVGWYRTVVVATGMFDFPRWPSIPGLADDGPAGLAGLAGPAGPDRPAVRHAADWRGPAGLRGRRVLIVGGASSGVELAEACASHGALVTVSTRSGRMNALPRYVLGRDPTHLFFPGVHRAPRGLTRHACEHGYTAPGVALAFARLAAQSRIVLRRQVIGFQGREARFASGPPARFDAVFLATGYRHTTPLLPTGIARTRAGHPRCHRCQSTSHPGLYFVGLPCAHKLTSAYLYGMARDSADVARQIAQRGP